MNPTFGCVSCTSCADPRSVCTIPAVTWIPVADFLLPTGEIPPICGLNHTADRVNCLLVLVVSLGGHLRWVRSHSRVNTSITRVTVGSSYSWDVDVPVLSKIDLGLVGALRDTLWDMPQYHLVSMTHWIWWRVSQARRLGLQQILFTKLMALFRCKGFSRCLNCFFSRSLSIRLRRLSIAIRTYKLFTVEIVGEAPVFTLFLWFTLTGRVISTFTLGDSAICQIIPFSLFIR